MELKVENLETSGASYGVDVSWTLPENNCDAFGYKIYYQEMDSDMEEFSKYSITVVLMCQFLMGIPFRFCLFFSSWRSTTNQNLIFQKIW